MADLESIASPPRSKARTARKKRIIPLRCWRSSAWTSRCGSTAGVDLAPFQDCLPRPTANSTPIAPTAILICHALTLDQHVANVHPLDRQGRMVGDHDRPGRPLDTGKYFIICSNVIGGCMGSTGPASTNPATGKVWGLDFPVVTIPDMVRAQDHAARSAGNRNAIVRHRRIDGRHAGAAMDRRLSGSACSRRCPLRSARATRRRTSRFTNSPGRP